MDDEPKYGPYATREDIQTLRADLIERIASGETRLSERIGTVETRLIDRISKVEGQLITLNRLAMASTLAIIVGVVKILFFGS